MWVDEYTNCDICANIYTLYKKEITKIYKEASKSIDKYAEISAIKKYGNKITIYTQMIILARNGALNKDMAYDHYVLDTLNIIDKELNKPDCNYEEILKELNDRLSIINTKYKHILEPEDEKGEREKR